MGSRTKKVLKDGGVLVVFGGVICAGSYLFLAAMDGGVGGPAPVVFDERVHAEPNPFIGDLRAARQLVEQRFAYLEHRRAEDRLDPAALEASALTELGADPDETAFRSALKRFVAGLRDGHAWVGFAEFRLPAERHWPFTPLYVAEGVMVDGVHPDAADRLRRGDVVLTVDGTRIEELVAEVGRTTFASSDGARRRFALDHLANWTEKTGIELSLLGLDGAERTVRVECPLIRLRIPRPGGLPTEREARMLAGGIAYFRPGSFQAPEGSGFVEASPAERREILAEPWAEIARTFESLGGARAMILDLRGNPGGTDLLGKYVVSHLLPPGQIYIQLSSLRSQGWSRPDPFVSDLPAVEQRLTVPLACLVDEETFSVADNVAACLRDVHPNVTFVGRSTGAGTGAPRSFTLPRTGTRVRFCTQRVYSPRGDLIEGTGVQPDVPSIRSREDVLAGKDTVLEAALELLSE